MLASVAAASSALQMVLLGEHHSAEFVVIEIFTGFQTGILGHVVPSILKLRFDLDDSSICDSAPYDNASPVTYSFQRTS